MMHTRWRLTAGLIAVAMLGVACGDSNFDSGVDETDSAPTSPDGTSDEGGGVDLELAGFASSPAEDAALNEILVGYEEQSDNTVQFTPSPDYQTTLQAALAGGQPPDAFYVNDNQLPDLAEAGALMPVEDRVVDPDDFYEPLKGSFTWDGEWYCPPKDFSVLALEYNTAMLEEAGVEPPTTWDELRAAAEALTTDDRVGLVIAPEWFRWGVFALQAGGDITNDDVTQMTADSDAMTQAFEFLAGLYADGIAATPADLDAGWAGEAFGQGKAAMTIEGNWIAPALENDFPDLPFAVTELPAGPAGQGTFSFSVCYGVAAAASDPDASWDLVSYLTAPEQMEAFTTKFAVMPSRPSLRDSWLEAHPDLQAFLDSVEFSQAAVYRPGFTAVIDTLNAGIQAVAAGDRQPAEVLAEVQEAGQGVLAE